MQRLLFLVNLLFIISSHCFSQTSDNAELKPLYEQDQNDRRGRITDWLLLSRNDSIRRSRVYQLIDEQKVITGKDNFHTAMIFQHGHDSIAYRMAIKHMKRAIELDSTINRWLLAAAIDRELMSRHRPQIYGTQYIKMNQPGSLWERYRMDTTKVTDEERRYYHVETLAGQREKVRRMNLKTIDEYYNVNHDLNKLTRFIRTENEKGIHSEYDVSENGINDFGYELMQTHPKDALKIF
ncbi:MAG TPA: hypothetical protein VHO90_07235, partial [Bacteroidales bacterium]|nr:hypothetical protein [Bacteroidales bacterium]